MKEFINISSVFVLGVPVCKFQCITNVWGEYQIAFQSHRPEKEAIPDSYTKYFTISSQIVVINKIGFKYVFNLIKTIMK